MARNASASANHRPPPLRIAAGANSVAAAPATSSAASANDSGESIPARICSITSGPMTPPMISNRCTDSEIWLRNPSTTSLRTLSGLCAKCRSTSCR